MTKVGLIIGGGTGRELGDVFKQSINQFARIAGKPIEIIECDHQFRTYHDLIGRPKDEIETIVREDVERMVTFYRDFYRSGGRVIFKTALNAETLYRFRAIGKAIKTVYIPLAKKKLLFVRDELQGFYANDSTLFDDREIRFTGSFSRANFQIIADYSINQANRFLQKNYQTWVVYKHHLFANLIENWARELFPDPTVCQPNHATDLLFQYLESTDGQDLLMITGNEAGDILHEVLIFKLRLGTRNTLCSRNTYLDSHMSGLEEYQTVHGSADNIAGQGIVDPVATLRAAAAIMEEQLQVPGFCTAVEAAVQQAYDSLSLAAHEERKSTTQLTHAVIASTKYEPSFSR